MIDLVVITDKKQLTELLKVDNLGRSMSDKGYQLQDPPLTKDWLYIAILQDEDIVGLAAAQWFAQDLLIWHFGLRKAYWGKGTEEYGKKIVELIATTFPKVKNMTLVPNKKILALAYAKRVGFKEKGQLDNYHILEL
jgi:hypothetical protein